MVIVVLSMPRIKYDDGDLEAGRFWWLLLSTWLLLFLAVACGFAAFTASAVAMLDNWQWLVGLLLPGGVLLALGGVLMVKRMFNDIFPGWLVVWKGLLLPCSCDSIALQPPQAEDVEMGQLVKSNEFWGRAAAAMKEAFSSGPSYQRLVNPGSSVSQAPAATAAGTAVRGQQVQALQLPEADVRQPTASTSDSIRGGSSSSSSNHPKLQQLRSLSRELASPDRCPGSRKRRS